MKIDLNCDMGEGCGNDDELMNYISSANIACGFHAGDAATMRKTVDAAIEKGVAIGAHPGYADRDNFGRTEMQLPPKKVIALVAEQIARLNEITVAAGGRLSHVKPHGALYNRSARDPELAAAIAQAVFEFDPGLILFGLSESVSISEAAKIGLRTASEVFADRTYQNDGSLTPRSEPNALIRDTGASIGQVLDMIKYGRVRSTDAIMVPIAAETVCIHGDGEHAVAFAKAISKSLTSAGVRIEAL